MLTGLFFVGGLAAFTYLCWWIYDNERHPDGMLPKRGLLAMATPDQLATEAQEKNIPSWKKKRKSAAASAVGKPRSRRSPSYRRTGR